MAKNTALLLTGFILLSQFGLLFSQDTIQREREILNKNIEFYQSGKYEKAEQNFSLMVSRLPDSQFLTTNYLMLIKSQYKIGMYMDAIKSAKNFLNSFASSDYRKDVFVTMGNSYYKLHRYTTAVNMWEDALQLSKDRRRVDRVGYLISQTVKYKLNQSESDIVARELNSADGQVLLGIGLAEKYIDQGSAYLATERLQSLIDKYPQSRFTPQARNLLNTGNVESSGQLRFALLLPLSGFNDQIGLELKEGIEFGLQEFNQNNPTQVELVIRDYGEEITRALKYYKELANNRSILAVLGPVENDISAAVAALSDYEKLALISPTATDGELQTLSNHFFQLNSTITKRSDYLANYAVDSLKIKRFATFSPVNNQFVKMIDSFSEIANGDSSQIVSEEWYYPGDQDVNKQFMNIKRKGLRLTFLDSLVTENPGIDTSIVDSLYRVYQEGQNELLEETGTKIDSADIPVTSIGGLFIPIYKEDIKFIAPQIAYSNIQTQLLGNGDWYDVEELKKNKNYINGIIFVSSGYLDEENWDYRQFRNKYRNTMKKTPSVYSMIGYDTINYMLLPLKNLKSPPGREIYINNLKAIRSHTGVYRSLKMDDNNCNVKLQLLKYDYGQIIPLN